MYNLLPTKYKKYCKKQGLNGIYIYALPVNPRAIKVIIPHKKLNNFSHIITNRLY